MKIITDKNMVELKQFQFPKKKNNKRWCKKYKKKYSRSIPKSDFIYDKINGIIICHPSMEKELIKALN